MLSRRIGRLLAHVKPTLCSGLIVAVRPCASLPAANALASIPFARSALQGYPQYPERMGNPAAVALLSYYQEMRDMSLKQQMLLHFHLMESTVFERLLYQFGDCLSGVETVLAMRSDALFLLSQKNSSAESVESLRAVERVLSRTVATWFSPMFLSVKKLQISKVEDLYSPTARFIMRNEAVHKISTLDELEMRASGCGLNIYMLMHPLMPLAPVAFINMALTSAPPSSMAQIFSRKASARWEPLNTAVFYSITSPHKGLRGIDMGNLLIKKLVGHLHRVSPHIDTFVTLSPIPGLRAWLKTQQMDENFLSLSTEAQTRLVAAYLTSRKDGRAVVDPVANFHLSNGAALWRINPAADESETGKNQSHGFMVNYMYDQQTLAANAESYADDAEITYSEHVLPFLFTKS